MVTLGSLGLAAVIGQEAAVHRLTAAAAKPVHAYLFLGPRGSGRLTAARAFAGEVLAAEGDSSAAQRHRDLAAAGRHPDVFEFDPQGRTLRVGEAEQLTVEASRSPVEGPRKVLICRRFHTAEPIAAASLLKTIEEPPATAIFVLLAEEVPPEHITVASRCTVIEFGPVPDDLVYEWLVGQGADADKATAASVAAQGNLDRARLLLDDPDVASRHAMWAGAIDRLDGTGHTVTVLVDEIRAAIDDAQAPLDRRHGAEAADLAAQEEQLGVKITARKDIEARQRREARRLRDDELRFGFATLAARYRDRLEMAGAADAVPALGALREATEALVRNPNEALLLQRLFLALAPS